MTILEKTYELATNAPRAMEWEEYSSWLSTAWTTLLRSDDAKDESKLQTFLEQHPCLVPGAYSFPPSGHSPFPGALISQPRLQGVGLKVPDFMWIASDSSTLYPVLVEIETPEKKWFTASGGMHSDFTSAYNQLAQWGAWFNVASNQQTFLNAFGIPTDRVAHHRFQPQFVLIHGSRSEIDARQDLNSLRAQYNTADFKVATFDRLTPQHNAAWYPCARREAAWYRLLSVPPSLQFGPGSASDFSLFRDRETVISSNALMSEERKQFLVRRLSYWDNWVLSGRRGVMNGADYE